MSYPWWTLGALPYSRFELPGWGRLLRKIGVLVPVGDTRWDHAPTRHARGKLHGYLMRLDLSNWAERMTYFLGRYYELNVQLLLTAVLRSGDRVVDIGGNIGMITLTMARTVGADGRVDCFEPNPRCIETLRHHTGLNRLGQVRIHAMALSDSPGQMRLNLTSSHTGTATLAEVDDVKEAIVVPVEVGDRVLASGPPIRLIKIDVEGFEMHVLRGLSQTLRRDRPMLITEFIEAQFARAGTSGAAIADLLRVLGYRPLAVTTRRDWFLHRLHLSDFDARQPRSNDVFWVHRDDGQVALPTPVTKDLRP
jgi:FkbM family methyltransferase